MPHIIVLLLFAEHCSRLLVVALHCSPVAAALLDQGKLAGNRRPVAVEDSRLEAGSHPSAVRTLVEDIPLGRRILVRHIQQGTAAVRSLVEPGSRPMDKLEVDRT